jgi:hypothetical protein
LVRVDPVTGDRTIISDDAVGSGPSFNFEPAATDAGAAISSVHYEADGSLLVAENGSGSSLSDSRIFRVDPATGNRTLISSAGFNGSTQTGSPGVFTGLYYDARDFGSSILVAGQNQEFALVDPTTGARTLYPIGGGTGPAPGTTGFVIDGTNVYFGNFGNGVVPSIMQLDTLTGTRSVLSGAGIGTGPALTLPTDVLIDNSGSLLALDNFSNLVRIDPVTGNRTIVSSASVGSGPTFFSFMLAETSANAVVTVTYGLALAHPGQVLAIDPVTGNRTVVSDASHGAGPSIYLASGITVVPNVPEPGTVLLAAVAAVVLLFNRRYFVKA